MLPRRAVAAVADSLVASPPSKRTLWLGATVCVTVLPLALVVVAAPPAGARPSSALVWLLFVASSVHVGSTAWFYSVREVRAHMARHPARYVYAPLGLIAVSAVVLTMV